MIKSLCFENISDTAGVLQMAKGHQYFLDRNTGLTNDAMVDHFVFNPDGVLANNRHFIAASQMEAQPNGDATTEGQSLQVMGYVYMYIATRDSVWLEKAKWCWDAYFNYFYWGQKMPTSPQPFICNWIINGKEPILANWPIDRKAPTHSGFKGEMMFYNNGITQVPHGEPYYGQFLDKATFAFDGALAWDAINASVQAINEDGSTNWNEDGVVYPVDWIVNWEGKKINWDGDVIEENLPEDQKGLIKLQDTTVNGEHKTNFANRQPIEFGGEYIERNQPWHNRPLNVPVPPDYLGNAADAELWWADACYLMWRVTGEDKYWMGWQCALETCRAYAEIDSKDKFFRKSVNDNTPFTDGISYDYTYPSEVEPVYTRDEEGYINIQIKEPTGAQVTIEQQAIWFRAGQNSKLRVQYGGVASDGSALEARAVLRLNSVKDSDAPGSTRWAAPFPVSKTSAVNTFDIPFSGLVEATKADGSSFVLSDSRSVVVYGDAKSDMVYENNVVDTRSALTNRVDMSKFSDGLIIGFWLLDDEALDVQAMSFKSNNAFELRVVDDDGWRWHWVMQDTVDKWVNKSLPRSSLILNEYQPNEDPEGKPPGWVPPPRPSRPNYTKLKQVVVVILDTEKDCYFQWYSVNELPRRFTANDTYTLLFSLTISGQKDFVAKVGDCTIVDFKENNLAFTPGTIPFSNISVPDTAQFDGWRGMPYPGYQYPFIYTIDQTPGEWNTHMTNMVEMLWQSQVAYTKKFGVVGPGMSAYIWNRWDNLKYGKPDTWTMYHWGDGTAWSGYQPRAMMGACRAWYELMLQGKPIPQKLKDYSENWIKWLVQFVKDSGGITPTDFPPESLPKPDPNDFTGHMCGLWLAGSCFAKLAGSKVEGLDFLIEACVTELENNFVNTGIPDQIMNGSWSPAVRLGTDNGMFFGFWSGEILRGMALYLLTKQMNVGDDMYNLIIKPDKTNE